MQKRESTHVQPWSSWLAEHPRGVISYRQLEQGPLLGQGVRRLAFLRVLGIDLVPACGRAMQPVGKAFTGPRWSAPSELRVATSSLPDRIDCPNDILSYLGETRIPLAGLLIHVEVAANLNHN